MTTWEPIADLDRSQQLPRDTQVAGLLAAWQDQRKDVTAVDERAGFERRLRREWAIETGVIEGVYQIDRGITEQLIEHGIDAALIPHGMATPSGELAARMAATHEEVLEGLFSFVKHEREISTAAIKELHAAITHDQDWVEGRDAAGRRTQVPLLHGAYKRMPNNPTHRNGSVHEYAPPLQVASEMERLVAMHEQHGRDAVDPVVASAWLHHRFTQVHPFQDGNGRVARALASIVLIRAGGFPLVVTREMRADYIAALERADAGDLSSLVALVGARQAMDLAAAITWLPEPSEALVERLATSWLRLRATADQLLTTARDRIDAIGARVRAASDEQPLDTLAQASVFTDVTRADDGRRGPKVAGLAMPARWLHAEWGAGSGGTLNLWISEPGRRYRGVMSAGATLAIGRADSHSLGGLFFLSDVEPESAARSRFETWLEGLLEDARRLTTA